MIVMCPKCGSLVYIGYSTHICGKCGHKGPDWKDVIAVHHRLIDINHMSFWWRTTGSSSSHLAHHKEEKCLKK